MSDLPQELQFSNTMHGSRENGGYIYHYEDTQGFGILIHVDRLTRKSPENIRWMARSIPYREFPTFKHLALAYDARSKEQHDKVMADWPEHLVIPEVVKPRSAGHPRKKCRLCDQPALYLFTQKDSWIEGDFGHFATICDGHAKLPHPDIARLLKEEITARKACSVDKSRQLLLAGLDAKEQDPL